jgi:hypothetical protein
MWRLMTGAVTKGTARALAEGRKRERPASVASR